MLRAEVRGPTVKYYAMEQLMRRQVGNQTSNSLLRQATFGSLVAAFVLFTFMLVLSCFFVFLPFLGE